MKVQINVKPLNYAAHRHESKSGSSNVNELFACGALTLQANK